MVGTGKKYDVQEKNVSLKEKWWKIGGKGEIFTVLGGKNIILKKGGGAKISHFWEIYTLYYIKLISWVLKLPMLVREGSHKNYGGGYRPGIKERIFF